MLINLGNLIYNFRKQNDLSLDKLAEMTCVCKSVLSKIELGQTKKPSFGTWKRIANVIDVPYYDMISFYVESVQRGETLKYILEEVVRKNHISLISKVARKFLDSPRMDTFLSLDYLMQYANSIENLKIRAILYDTVIYYARNRGVPFYLAKALYERYLLERDDFLRLSETYRRGSELIHYTEHLNNIEYTIFFYRIGVHAYALQDYDKCIYLCKKGFDKDHSDNQLRAEALSAVVASYLALGDYTLADLYLREYSESQYADYKKDHAKAMIFTKSGQLKEAEKIYMELLESLDRERRITILVDLMDVYFAMGDRESIGKLIESENDYLPSNNVNNPRRIEKLAKYFRLKGSYMLSVGRLQEGTDNLIHSAEFYQKLGNSQEAIKCLGIVLDSYKKFGEKGQNELMEKIVKLCNNDTK